MIYFVLFLTQSGGPFSIYGSDRVAALKELKKQILGIEDLIFTFNTKNPTLCGNYLCGTEISLADAALFPTMVFFMFILPKIYNIPREGEDAFIGPILNKWYEWVGENNNVLKGIKEVILKEMNGWYESGRWTLILEEMKGINEKI